MSEDERTEEQYLRILLWEFALRFNVTCESGSRGLREKLHHRTCRTWLVLRCEGQPMRQLWQAAIAVSGEYSGRSGLLKRQTDGGYPSCVQRTRQGDAGEVELGCYVLCGCTKGRQCVSTVALRRRHFMAVRAIWSGDLLYGSRSTARTEDKVAEHCLWLWKLSPSTSTFSSRPFSLASGEKVAEGRMRGHGMHAE